MTAVVSVDRIVLEKGNGSTIYNHQQTHCVILKRVLKRLLNRLKKHERKTVE